MAKQIVFDGKTKEHFEKWYNPEKYDRSLEEFWELDLSLQWGIIEDFTDDKALGMSILASEKNRFSYRTDNPVSKSEELETREEARVKAGTAVNRIINSGD